MSALCCIACHGTGRLDPDCERCEGAGWEYRGNDGEVPCPRCEKDCEHCSGSGYEP